MQVAEADKVYGCRCSKSLLLLIFSFSCIPQRIKSAPETECQSTLSILTKHQRAGCSDIESHREEADTVDLRLQHQRCGIICRLHGRQVKAEVVGDQHRDHGLHVGPFFRCEQVGYHGSQRAMQHPDKAGDDLLQACEGI